MVEDSIIPVGFGKLEVTNSPSSVLVAFGLGSCIAVSLYDPVEKIAGMIHIVLPYSNDDKMEHSSATKYANTGIPILLKEVLKMGAKKFRLEVKVVGGAQILKRNYPVNSFDIAEKNLKAVKDTLKKLNLYVTSEDTGGTKGRTFRLFVDTGKAVIKMGDLQKEI